MGFVPTMGALHAGHAALITSAKHHATWTAVSIFLNPKQFGATEDLSRYPADLDRDMNLCRSLGVDVVFAPAVEDLYPQGFQTTVDVTELSSRWEGSHRPGHFKGVCTVVAKLACLVGDCVLWMGRKDYQQWKVIERLVADLHLPARVQAHPIVRDAQGLALSSRNAYLSSDDYPRALSLVQGLRQAGHAFTKGERRHHELLSLAHTPLHDNKAKIDYAVIVDHENMTELASPLPERALLAIAAYIGETRLIDNMVLGEDPVP